MKLKIVARFLAVIVFLISACMLMPLVWAVREGGNEVRAFSLSILFGLLFSSALFWFSRKAQGRDMGTREAFAAVALAWIFASFQGCLPYYLGGYVSDFTEAYFEAMSGFTTTGATIFRDIETLPRGIIFWRAVTHWLGGMGIVVLTLALLPMLGMGVTQLFKAEVPGPVLEKISPRIQDSALMLWKVYLGITAAGILLMLAGGMDLYDSVCHVFAAVSTGGFSTRNQSVGWYHSAFIDWSLTAVMFVSGANFGLHLLAIKNRTLKPYRDPEFKFYSGVALLSTFVITTSLFRNSCYPTIIECLRYSAFQAVSMMTTTGFVTADFSKWPTITQMTIVVLMFIGGCAGSTSGAIKCIRIQMVLKQISAEVRRFIHPHAYVPIRLGDKTITDKLAFSASSFIALYFVIFAVAAVMISYTGEDVVTSITAVAVTLGNIGPGLGDVGPATTFHTQTILAKWIYVFCMLCGRLELYTVLVLFTKDAWHR